MSEQEERKETRIFSSHNWLSLYLPALILSLGGGIATPALPVYTKSFDISFGVASLVIIVYMAGSLLSSLPTGYLIDRIGRRKMILTGPLLTALSSFLVPFARSFPELLVYRFLGGWASQMWLITRLAIIADTGASGQRGRQITGMIGLESVGRLLGPAIGGFAAAWDIRLPFLLHGLLCIVAIIPSFKMIQETAPGRAAGPGRGPAPGGSHPASSGFSLFVFPILLLLAVQFLVALTRGVIWGGSLDLYGVYLYDIGARTLGILNAINSAIGIPLTFAAGYLMDRFGRKATIVPGFSLLAASFIFMALTSHFHWAFPVFLAAYFCVNFAQGVTSGSMQTLGSDLAPADARGQFFGTWRMVQEIGSVLSPALFTLIAEYQSFTAAFLFLCLTSFSVAFLVGTQVPETLKK